jgi:predicted phosphodiesterase
MSSDFYIVGNEQLQHELISALKEAAIELGRTPTRVEFEAKVIGGRRKIDRLFRNYALLLQAAGLDSYEERRSAKKITGAVFNRNIEAHLDAYDPREYQPFGPFHTMAIISDIHWPFENKKVVKKFIQYVKDHKPEFVIIDGDAWDMYAHSKYPRSHNVFTPRQEEDLSRKKNEEFWAEIKKASPRSKCVQLLGNHDVRPMKRVLEAYPEAEDWVNEKLTNLFSFPGVKTIMDAREELIVGDVLVFHGYLGKLGAHRDFTLMSTINGHTHKGGVVYRQVKGKVLFELNCGVAGDPHSKGLTYTPQRITAWTPGFGAVTKYGPIFIPL